MVFRAFTFLVFLCVSAFCYSADSENSSEQKLSFPIKSDKFRLLTEFNGSDSNTKAASDYRLDPRSGFLPLSAFESKTDLAIDTRIGQLRILMDVNRYQIASNILTLQPLASIERSDNADDIKALNKALVKDPELKDIRELEALQETEQGLAVVDIELPELEASVLDPTLYLKDFKAVWVSELLFDDSAFSDTQAGESWVNTNNVNVSATLQRRKNIYLASYSAIDHRALNGVVESFFSQKAYVNLNQEIGRRNQISLSWQWDQHQENRGTGILDGLVTDNIRSIGVDRSKLSLGHTLGDEKSRMRIKSELFLEEQEYEQIEGIIDVGSYERSGFNVDLLYRLGARTRIVGAYNQDSLDYNNDQLGILVGEDSLDASSIRYDIGLEKDIGRISSAALRVGQYSRSFEADIDDSESTTWNLEYTVNPKSYSRVSISIGQSFTPSRGVGTFIDSDEARMTWSHGWSQRLRSRLTLGYFQDTFVGDFRADHRYTASGVLEYAFNNDLRFAIGARYAKRDSNEVNFEFDRNVYYLRSTYRF